jgi:hypothetical protein
MLRRFLISYPTGPKVRSAYTGRKTAISENESHCKGRAHHVEVDPRQVAGLRARALSWNQIAGQLGIGRGTAERAYSSLSQKSPLLTTDPELIS